MIFHKFDTITGQYLGTVDCPDGLESLQLQANQIRVEPYFLTVHDDPQGYTYDTSTRMLSRKIESPAMLRLPEPFLGDSTSVATVLDIPAPALLTVSGLGMFTVDDGSFEFTVDLPGTYMVTVTHPKYLDKVFEVVAT